MGKPSAEQAIALLAAVVDAMAAHTPETAHGEATASDARLVRALAARFLADGDPWARLVLDTLERALADDSATVRLGPREWAEMLAELARPDAVA